MRKKTADQFKQEVYEKVKDEYEVLGEYLGANTPIEIKHNYCGNIYKVKPSNFLNIGNRCPKCSKNRKSK